MKKNEWMEALAAQGLEVRSARDALSVQGYLDSGNYALNWAMCGRFLGGYPLGHTAELFGDPSTGKSFLVARAIATAQSHGGVALLDDTEGAYNLEWIHNLGVDANVLGYYRSRTVTDHLDVATRFVEAYRKIGGKKLGLLACDSLSLLSTEHELESRLEKRDMTKASELKAFFRIMGSEFNALPLVHISTSHTIAKIGDFINTRTTPGGGGPKFQASVRVDLRAVSRIKQGGEYVGVIARAVIDKTRLTSPWKEARLAIPFYQPISPASGLVEALLNLGVLGESGHNITYRGENLGIPTHKSKSAFLKQDESGEQLLDQIPEILEEVDAWLASGGQKHAWGEELEADRPAEPDPEEVEV